MFSKVLYWSIYGCIFSSLRAKLNHLTINKFTLSSFTWLKSHDCRVWCSYLFHQMSYFLYFCLFFQFFFLLKVLQKFWFTCELWLTTSKCIQYTLISWARFVSVANFWTLWLSEHAIPYKIPQTGTFYIDQFIQWQFRCFPLIVQTQLWFSEI